MKKIPILFLLAILCNIVNAQVPTLKVQHQNKDKNLEISQLNIDVEIVGNIATTTYDIVFYNPFNRVLTGELAMPLKESQEISRYALDVNGKLREGVIVEKIKARQAFEAVVRQNIDPGIINKTKGNSFNTKIYPIPANGSKRVVIAFVQTLKGDTQNLYYSLPIENMPIIKQFSLNVKAIKNQIESKKIQSDFQNIQFDNLNNAHVFSLKRENFTTAKPINFTIPRLKNNDYQLFTYDFEGDTYFYLNMKPSKLNQKKKPSPKDIAIFWDHSFSADKRNTSKELELLELYLSTIKSRINIYVTSFNQEVDKPKKFTSVKKALTYIKNLKNDGATLFENIKMPKKVDEIFLFTDGVNTIGKDQVKINNCPIYTITSSAGSNFNFLKNLSVKTNGEFINLNAVKIERALKLLKYDEEKFLSYKCNKNNIIEVYPNTPTRVNTYFEISGKLLKNQAELALNFGGKKGITQTKTFLIKKTNGTKAVSRIWATKKIFSLNFEYEKNKKDILALSQKFGIITKNTSLLVLDRVEDYATHNIEPPAELLEKYKELLARKKQYQKPKITEKEIEKETIKRLKKIKRWYKNPTKLPKPEHKRRIPRRYRRSTRKRLAMPTLGIEVGSSTTKRNVREVRKSKALANFPRRVELDGDDEESNEAIIDTGKNIKEKSSIKILSWMPDAPYIKELRKSKDKLSLYYKLKKENKNRPSFYIQVSDLFFSLGKHKLGIQILSNAIELDLENPELLKVVARRFMNEEEYGLAIKVFEEIKNLRPEEPQSYRDLALAYRLNKEYQKALDLYLFILNTKWQRFDMIKDVVFNEINSLINLHAKALDLSKVNKAYIKNMPLDIRITLDWSSNDNDIDLWVVDPKGEKCYYSNKRTKTGGKISSDYTRGYGPEEFSMKKAIRGFYTVYVNYFSESRQSITGPVTIYVELTTHYGTVNQETRRLAIQLENNKSKETKQVGQLEFKE